MNNPKWAPTYDIVKKILAFVRFIYFITFAALCILKNCIFLLLQLRAGNIQVKNILL